MFPLFLFCDWGGGEPEAFENGQHGVVQFLGLDEDGGEFFEGGNNENFVIIKTEDGFEFAVHDRREDAWVAFG